MRFQIKILLLSLVAAAAVMTAGCPRHETISRIQADPGRYNKREVEIAGKVTDSYGVLGRGAYEIDDGTGRMWVITDRGVPARGATVGTRGYVYNGFSLGGRSFGTVLQESERRTTGR